MVQTDQFFYIGLSTKDKLKFTAWFEVNPTFGSREIRLLKPGGPFGPPPPRLIRVKPSLFFQQLLNNLF